MSRLRFFSFLAIAFAVLFVSCSKEKEPVDPNDDRHIVGYEEDGKGKFIYGDATILSDNDSINSLVFDSSMVTFYVRVRHYHYSDDTYEDSDPCTILEFYHKNLGQMNCDSIIYSADTSSFTGEGIFCDRQPRDSGYGNVRRPGRHLPQQFQDQLQPSCMGQLFSQVLTIPETSKLDFSDSCSIKQMRIRDYSLWSL